MSEITDLSNTDSSNTSVSGFSTDGNVANMSTTDDVFQAVLGLLARTIGDATIAAAATTNLGSLPGASVVVTGNTNITSFGTIKAGTIKFVKFTGTPTLTYNATSLVLPGSLNIVAAIGDTAVFVSKGGGNWECIGYFRGNGSSINPAIALMDSKPSLIVNGNFQDAFENPGSPVLTANNSYPAEQFFLNYSASGAGLSVQLLNNVRTLLGNDRVAEIKCTTAKPSLGATDFVNFSTIIEGSRPDFKAAAFGTADAKPFVFALEEALPTGTIHIHAQNSAGNRHIAIPIVVPPADNNVAKRRVISIPADTTGTWLFGNGDKGLVIDIVLAAGATLTGGTASTWGATARLAATTQFNILSSTSNVARIADVGLKNDPDATGVYGLFKVNDTDAIYQSTRYYWKTYYPNVALASATEEGCWTLRSYNTATLIDPNVPLPNMARTPSFTFYSTFDGQLNTVRDASAGSNRSVAASTGWRNGLSQLTLGSALPINNLARFHIVANARL